VRFLLENEQNIESILFYTTSQPIADSNLSKDDWKNALFANAVSFNYPVVGDYVDGNSTLAIGSDTLNGEQKDFTTLTAINANSNSESDPVSDLVSDMSSDTALVGYINITLNLAAVGSDWVHTNVW